MIPNNPISKSAVSITPAGGSAGVTSGASGKLTSDALTVFPYQLIGFVPLTLCSFSECRTFNGSCYLNPVFGTQNEIGSTYENDLSTFYINDSLKRVTKFILQKLNRVSLTWTDLAVIGSTNPSMFPSVSTYGSFYNYGHSLFTTHPKYFGMRVNWGSVLTLQGTGVYRIMVLSPTVLPGGTPIDPNPFLNRPNPYPYCMASEPFNLNPFNCDRAHGTAKFEANQSGRIGSIDIAGYVFDLCNISLYDSIRQIGFFGNEKTGYDEIMLEHQNGLMDRVRDEALQRFDWGSKPMPKYIHDRFKSYGMMADSLWVSDYNKNNADYNIKKKMIVKSAGYEPEYPKGSRLSWVKTEFKEGIQSVIKSSSCEIKPKT